MCVEEGVKTVDRFFQPLYLIGQKLSAGTDKSVRCCPPECCGQRTIGCWIPNLKMNAILLRI